jgi:hypothetical protein
MNPNNDNTSSNNTIDINLENELDIQMAHANEWEIQMDEYERQAEMGEYLAYEDEDEGDELAADCPLTPPPTPDILEIARENWNHRGANAGPICDQCEQDRTGYGGRICLACDTQPEECGCGCDGVWEDHELWYRIRRDLSQSFVHIEIPPPVTQG